MEQQFQKASSDVVEMETRHNGKFKLGNMTPFGRVVGFDLVGGGIIVRFEDERIAADDADEPNVTRQTWLTVLRENILWIKSQKETRDLELECVNGLVDFQGNPV